MSTFKDERLQRAVEESGVALAQRLQKLDLISHDIKELEQHFVASGIRERVEHKFEGGASVTRDPRLDAENGEGPAEEVYEFIIWEKAVNQDRWRIMYMKTRRDGYWDEVIPDLFSFEGEPEVVDHRPLIEKPAEVRLRAAEALPDFVSAVTSQATPRREVGPKAI